MRTPCAHLSPSLSPRRSHVVEKRGEESSDDSEDTGGEKLSPRRDQSQDEKGPTLDGGSGDDDYRQVKSKRQQLKEKKKRQKAKKKEVAPRVGQALFNEEWERERLWSLDSLITLPVSTVCSILHRLRDTGEVQVSHHRPCAPWYTTRELSYEWSYSELRDAWREKFGSAKKLSSTRLESAVHQPHQYRSWRRSPRRGMTPSATRKAYCHEATHWPRDCVIFIDEVGSTLWQKCRRRRSLRGRPARAKLTRVEGQ